MVDRSALEAQEVREQGQIPQFGVGLTILMRRLSFV